MPRATILMENPDQLSPFLRTSARNFSKRPSSASIAQYASGNRGSSKRALTWNATQSKQPPRRSPRLTKGSIPEPVVQRLHEDAAAIRALANPLFVQAYLTIELILEIPHTAINYFAQRRPDELGRFAWRIDRKDRTVTEMEKLWSMLILPFGEPRSAL
jgi:hypothetical protein